MRNLFFILTILYSFSSCSQDTKKSRLISQKEFTKISTKQLQLLDVRTPEEYHQGFIDGAILINFFDADFVKKVNSTFDKNKPLYLYCAAGGRSNKAIVKLLLDGFDEVYDLKGGYRGWKKNK
tara:strand:+ start:375 stop:743 length:369 start_codon:yes stop_codon:yes gene_type:complete